MQQINYWIEKLKWEITIEFCHQRLIFLAKMAPHRKSACDTSTYFNKDFIIDFYISDNKLAGQMF